MKKITKISASLFLSAALLSSSINFDGFNVGASAADDITTKVTYADDGAAILEITPSEWENQIRYTTDGSAPTADSPLYVSTISITKQTVVRIAEFEDGKKISGVKTTITPKTAPVSFFVEQNYDEGTATITMDCETLGAKIYYTTDGTKPSQDSTLYLGPIEVDENVKVRARAYKDGYLTKTTYLRTIKVKKNADVEEKEVEVKDNTSETSKETSEKTETETETKTETETTEKTSTTEKTETKTEEKKIVIEKDSEESSVKEKVDCKFTYMDTTQKTYVTVLKSKTSNIVRYTTDGSAVTKNSPKYSKRVAFTEPGVFRAKEYTSSGKLVATLKVNVKIKCAPVQLVCTDISLAVKEIDFRCETEGVTIYYTTNGENPTVENAEIYDGKPIALSEELVVAARAMKDGYKDGNISREVVAGIPYVVQDLDYDRPEITEVVDAVNALRRANGLSELEATEGTTMVANVRAKEISLRPEHLRPNGGTYRSAFTERDLIIVDSFEIFATTCKSADQFFSQVLRTSKAQLIDPYSNYSSIGVGYYEHTNKKYWVLILAGDKN